MERSSVVSLVRLISWPRVVCGTVSCRRGSFNWQASHGDVIL